LAAWSGSPAAIRDRSHPSSGKPMPRIMSAESDSRQIAAADEVIE
jgi:hypothetical protein